MNCDIPVRPKKIWQLQDVSFYPETEGQKLSSSSCLDKVSVCKTSPPCKEFLFLIILVLQFVSSLFLFLIGDAVGL